MGSLDLTVIADFIIKFSLSPEIISEINLDQDQGESREYNFPQNLPYDEKMSQAEIIGDGSPGNALSVYGQLHKTLYLLWPFLADGITWDSENIPESSITIKVVPEELIK